MNKNTINCERSLEIIRSVRSGMAETIVGQGALIDGMLIACIAGGHVLLEGVPGLAKTLAVKTFSDLCALSFKRIQFTPDLLPADLIGTLIYNHEKAEFSVRKGPVFANLVLADEINRAPAKVQSALLEAMAERQVTIGETTYALPVPFFVLATQNPIEQEGTYTLPEAELDRFLFKLHVPYPSLEEERQIVSRSGFSASPSQATQRSGSPVISAEDLSHVRETAAQVTCDESLTDYIVRLIASTRPAPAVRKDKRQRDDYIRYIAFGASPRASIALCQTAKIHALFEGRSYVTPEDIKVVAHPVLRHRLVLSYEAGAENLSADDIIDRILGIVPLP